MASLSTVVNHLDNLLEVSRTPDYTPALNGLQVENRGEVRRVAVAVDVSELAIERAIAGGADLLIVHHGLFWGGLRTVTGSYYRRLRALIANDVALYAAHLPLDRHSALGNNALLARALDLHPSGEFARYEGVAIGVSGQSDVPTAELVDRAARFAASYGGTAHASAVAADRRTRAWGICTGAGASADTLDEAVARGLDTLIVGEGPHWTAVDAPERGLVIIYAGHYATETLGVQALGRELEAKFALPWSFILAPTGM
jgi:dinuclear metal center YbgI/SA1388 family protein